MKIITAALLLLATATQAQGIRFTKDLSWQQIKAKATQEKQFILLDAYATWCGPCKEMNEKTFPEKSVGDYFNNRFLSVQVQMDRTAQDNQSVRNWYADAETIAKEVPVMVYPTCLFFAPDGVLVLRAEGYMTPDDLISKAKQAVELYETFSELYTSYQQGARDSVTVRKLATIARQALRPEVTKQVVQTYINGLSEKDMLIRNNVELARDFSTSSKDRAFSFFAKHAKQVDAVLGASMGEQFRYAVLANETTKELRKNGLAGGADKIEKQLIAQHGETGKRAVYAALSGYSWEKKDVSGFVKYKDKTHTKWASDISFFYMNNDAWWVFERTNDKKLLESALRWQAKVIKAEAANPNPNAIDTYANLLYKLGRKQEAIKWQQKATNIDSSNAAKNNWQPNAVFRETVEKMKAGKPTWPEVK